MNSSSFSYRQCLLDVLLLWISCNINYVQPVEIDCIPVKLCPLAVELISTKKYAPETIELLNFSHCGYNEENEPMIWCANFTSCITPDQRNGKCVHVKRCEPYQNLIKNSNLRNTNTRKYISKFRCSSPFNKEIHVCCPVTEETTVTKRFSDSDYDGIIEPHSADKDYYDSHNHDPFNHQHSFEQMSNNNHDHWINNNHNNRWGTHKHRYSPDRNGYDNNEESWDTNMYKDTPEDNNKRDRGFPKPQNINEEGRTQRTRDTNIQNDEFWSTSSETTPKVFDIITRRSSVSRSNDQPTTPKWRRDPTNSENGRRACETPDNKSGVCVKQNKCQSYLTLKNSLDIRQSGIKRFLDGFITVCKTPGAQEIQVCCDEERNLNDNSVFDRERFNDNVPEPISKICGRQTANDNKIVGGNLTNMGEFPWMALLQYQSTKGKQFACGGTLINERYVLTAAHCVDNKILKQKGLGRVHQIVLGEYDTRNRTDCIYTQFGNKCADPPKNYKVASIIRHHLYSSTNASHDIALIKLDRKVTFTDYVKPICLPTNTSTLRGNETFVVAGWGRTFEGKSSPVLIKAKLPIVGKANCNALSSRPLTDGQICAGRGNGMDSCNGDSGGPLMLQINFNFEFVTHVVGIVSYGFGECGSSPSVNTYVPYYIDWINENIK